MGSRAITPPSRTAKRSGKTHAAEYYRFSPDKTYPFIEALPYIAVVSRSRCFLFGVAWYDPNRNKIMATT